MFGPGGPTLKNHVAHFVERQRGNGVAPTPVFSLIEGERVASILQLGALRGFEVHGSKLSKAVCVSDISGAELEAAFQWGLNSRGPIPPWAVVLNRKRLWERNFRPVIYAAASDVKTFQTASADAHGEGWEALVVSMNPLEEGRDDWTHEREWRFCFRPGHPSPQVDVQDAIQAIVVGVAGWLPPANWIVPEAFGTAPSAGVDFRVRRWLWDRDKNLLVHDGEVVVERQERGR